MKTNTRAIRFFVIGALAVAATRFGAMGAQQDQDAKPIEIVLERILEKRQVDLVKTDDQFNMFDDPQLELRFGWRLPKGRKLVSIDEPESLVAKDSAGTDLAKLPKNMFGRVEHITVIQEWQGPATAFTVKLLPAARSAAKFSLKARMQATTYMNTTTTTIVAGKKWQSLDGSLGLPDGARAHVQNQGGTLGLVVQPASLREQFEKVELLSGGQPVKSGSTMWNDQEITYMFDTAPKTPAENVKIRLTVRTGLQKQPIVIDLRDQPLP